MKCALCENGANASQRRVMPAVLFNGVGLRATPRGAGWMVDKRDMLGLRITQMNMSNKELHFAHIISICKCSIA